MVVLLQDVVLLVQVVLNRLDLAVPKVHVGQDIVPWPQDRFQMLSPRLVVLPRLTAMSMP